MIRDYDETIYLTKRYKNRNTPEAKKKRVDGLRKILPMMKLEKICKYCKEIFKRNKEKYSAWRGKTFCSKECVRLAHEEKRKLKRAEAAASKMRGHPLMQSTTDFWLYKYKPLGD